MEVRAAHAVLAVAAGGWELGATPVFLGVFLAAGFLAAGFFLVTGFLALGVVGFFLGVALAFFGLAAPSAFFLGAAFFLGFFSPAAGVHTHAAAAATASVRTRCRTGLPVQVLQAVWVCVRARACVR